MKPTYEQLWQERESLTETVSLLQMKMSFLLERLEMYQQVVARSSGKDKEIKKAIRNFIEASESESSWLPAFEKLDQISRQP